ncbi:DNA polymerase delta subunit 3 [Dendrobium catenatum]|uniref:DNA polymerase delta subunit 3 n=1 Tax=Dendrobium catenatum TaxID=906689 RepID=UPI0009F3F8AF|nr:DNA polymerase delta subunit 3 [Dendrobium catenatum]
MLAVEALEILGQIQVLVIDKLQVVSYKWLSRKFSVSSNQAKKLLREFVDKHGNNLEVLYSLSGWLKNSSGTYCIRLASGKKLEEVMKEFDGTCSVEVYSIQSCLPRDLAVLWNAEFVQAEELFNQPSTVENCLRNNRFGGISNCFVKRAVNGQSAAVSSTSQLKDNVGIVQTKASNVTKDENLQPQQENRGQFGVKEELKSSSTVGSIDKTNQNVGEYTKKTHPVKESSNPLQAKRKGIPNEKTSTGPGGSLATLWGRASVKSKPSSMASRSTCDIAIAANTADAQICAEEAADAESSDEEGYKLCYKRESNGSSTRKRQFIINYSDEEDDDDNVVSLASPIPPKEKSFSDTMQSAENLNVEKEILCTNKLERETLVNKQDIDDKSHGLSSEKSSIANASFQKAENNFQNDLASANGKDTAPMASKRKKVVKTRIDERGREVTEVVWDEPVCSKDADKDKTTNDARPTAAIKEQATASNAPPNTGIKGGTKKPLKGGGKDTKQGKILSFFKKI